MKTNKKLFYLVSLGYDGARSFHSINAARFALRECVEAEKKACQARFGCAFVKWFANKDGAKVLIGENSQAFQLWSVHNIVSA